MTLILNSIASLLANVKVSASVVVVLMNKPGACHFVNVDATLNNIKVYTLSYNYV